MLKCQSAMPLVLFLIVVLPHFYKKARKIFGHLCQHYEEDLFIFVKG